MSEAQGVQPSARILTFLIADIRGYTAFTQQRGDEAAARLARTFADIVGEGVEAWDGSLVELRGDEALAVFASPRQALRAALELQAVLADESRLHPEFPLTVGMGLDAGEAVPVAGGFRGGALNLAARLCSRAGPGEVLASPEVIHLARAIDGVGYQERADLDLKGLAGATRAYAVAQEAGGPGPGEGRRGATPDAGARAMELPPELDQATPLLGRDREGRRIRWQWRLARSGRGRVVVVTGPPGAGRTRLVGEAAALAARDGATVAYAGRPADVAVLASAASASDGPALLVLDDVADAGAADVRTVERLVALVRDRPALLAVVLDETDGAPGPEIDVLRRLGRDAFARIHLDPLGDDAADAIARLYLDDPNLVVPARAIAQAADGLPARIHALAAAWARDEAARRLGENVSRAAAGRSELRVIENALTGNVIDLQLARERSSLYAPPHPAAAGAPDAAPYKGLATFEEEDAGAFFGRERLVAELLARLAGATFLAVVGPSGSGKSSAVRAGLLPAIASGTLPGSDRWIRAVLRPGPQPLRELDRVVYAALPPARREGLSGGGGLVVDAAGRLPDGARLLVVVDQFEEAFTACEDEAERSAFIDEVVAAARDGRVTIIVALRADFYGRGAEDARFAELLARNHVLVGPMSGDEYRRAIEQPARRAGARIEPALVDALLDDVVGEPGALPLLSTALLELWQRREGRTIPVAAYAATGGVRGAVARLAEHAYGQLSEAEQRQARGVLLRLAAGEGDVAVRRRVPLSEFDAATNADIGRVLAVLTQSRLLTVDEQTVEIAHEALLREWPRLRTWLEEDREGRRLREHLTDAAREWAIAGRDAGELYRGARLATALDWTAEHTLELNELEREFLGASRSASDREADRQRRVNRRLRLLLAGVAVLFVASVGAGGLAAVRQSEAERAAAAAEEQRAAANTAALAADAQRLGAQALVERDLDLSLLLARQAVELHDAPETRANLLAALMRSPAAVLATRPAPGRLLHVAATPNGGPLLVDSNEVGLWRVDPETGTSLGPMTGPGFPVLVGDRIVRIVEQPHAGLSRPPFELLVEDAESRRRITSTTIPAERGGFSWSPDLSRLAIASGDGRAVTIHDFETLELLDTMPAPDGMTVWDVYWYGQDRLLMLMHDGPLPPPGDFAGDHPVTYSWWRVGADTPEGQLSEQPEDVRLPEAFAGSDDGNWLAFGHGDGAVSIVDLRTNETRAGRGRHAGRVTSLGFSPDGATLVSTSDDRLVFVWDVASGEHVETLEGHNGRVFGPAFGTHRGRPTLYTVGLDGLLIGWDLEGSTRIGRPFRPAPEWDIRVGEERLAYRHGIAVSPDGATFAVSSTTGDVTIYETASGREIRTLAASRGGPALDVAFSPDGRWLAIAGFGEELVTLWETSGWTRSRERFPASPGELRPRGGPEPSHARTVAFSPDGRFLAAGVAGRRLWIWEVASRQALAEPITFGGEAGEVTFSPDSTRIAVIHAAGEGIAARATTWTVDDRRQLYTVDADNSYGIPGAVAFSPDGRVLATGGGSSEIRFFDAATGDPLPDRPPLIGAAGWVIALEFTPDGQGLISGGGDGTIRLFDMARHVQLGESLPAPANRSVSPALTPDGTRLVTVHDTGVGYIWDLDAARWKERACAVAARSLTEREWREVLPDRPYQPACP